MSLKGVSAECLNRSVVTRPRAPRQVGYLYVDKPAPVTADDFYLTGGDDAVCFEHLNSWSTRIFIDTLCP